MRRVIGAAAACAAAAAATALVVPVGQSNRVAPHASVRGPFLLVTLPSLGTVTWTCEPRRYPSFALAYRASPRYATTYLVLRAGTRRVTRRVHPGRVVTFPFSSTRTQLLSLVQGTGAGVLRASVRVDFVPNRPVVYCWSYAPPALTVRTFPRE